MIYMALLAHEDEQALRNQIRNVRKYNPQDVQIVFYNGGQDANFGKSLRRREGHVLPLQPSFEAAYQRSILL